MNQAAIPVLSVVLSLGAAIGTTVLMRPAEAGPDLRAAELQTRLDALQRDHAALAAKVAQAAAAPTPAAAAAAHPGALERSAAPTVSSEQVAAAVEAYLKARGGAAPAEASVPATFDMATDFKALVGTNFWSNSAAWRRAFAAGKMDEVIKEFEALAKASPTDTKVQMQLANAYLAYVNMDQTKYQYSMQADQVFDTILAQDERHWEARFTKAVSYSFWPEFLGKKQSAIEHFETLVTQQEAMPVEASQAQTYLYLGNMLVRSNPARASEVWAIGARRHPDNAELAQKVAPK